MTIASETTMYLWVVIFDGSLFCSLNGLCILKLSIINTLVHIHLRRRAEPRRHLRQRRTPSALTSLFLPESKSLLLNPDVHFCISLPILQNAPACPAHIQKTAARY